MPAPLNRTSRDYSTGSTGGRIRDNNIYIGFVKRNDDAQRMGRISVWIPEIGGDPTSESAWIIISYASPFAGVTDQKNVQNSQVDTGSQMSYGMWMQAPDLDNQVLVCFVNGDLARGYYFGCIWQQNMNHMVPGIAANTPTDPTRKNDGSGALPPVVEYNRKNVQSTSSAARPIFTALDNGLKTQGLNSDFERGPSASSVRRESPSKVFGMSTPRANQLYIDDNPDNEFIRMRTRSGAQVLINETSGYVYINTPLGNSWVEISDNGIDMYTSKSISMRAQTDINLRADRNIIMDAGNSIFMNSGEDTDMIAGKNINIGAAFDLIQSGTSGKLSLRSGTDLFIKAGATVQTEAITTMSIKSGGDMVTGSGGNINTTAANTNARFGALITDNSGTGPSPTSPPDFYGEGPVPHTVGDISIIGSGNSATTTDTIVSRMPTHEPWAGHPRRDVPNKSGVFKPAYPPAGQIPTGEGYKPGSASNNGCPVGVGALTASDTLYSAMSQAASTTGLPLPLIMAVGATESKFTSSPSTKTTGAQGVFQIEPSTWTDLVNQYGATDNVGMSQINDERGSALMGARYLAQQQTALQGMGIANPTSAQIYGMYNVGAGGYKALLNADPNSSAVDAVGATSANGNPSFYYTNGQPNTVAQTLAAYDNTINPQVAAYGGQASAGPPCSRGGGSGSVSANASSYLGGPPVGSGQCVALVQAATGVGNTSTWSQGAQVSGNSSIAPGTAIATFGSNGTYTNSTDGSSHAAIYQSTNADGSINVIDQWLGQPPQQRTIQMNGSAAQANNAGAFYVINTPTAVASN